MTKPQLFCFTYAGGTGAFFDEIGKDLPNLDLVKLEYAGHGARRSEPFYSDFDQLAEDLFDKVREQYRGGKYALFGYSMGSISLVEVLRRNLRTKTPLPNHIFLAAHEPHTKSELQGFVSDELDDWVKRRTISFGAVPEKLLDNPVFWRTYLPLYRADYSIIGKYRFEELDLCTEIPLTVFYSETDTPLREMKKWKKYFVGESDFHRFDGKHFFIQQHHQEIAAIITEKLGEKYDVQ